MARRIIAVDGPAAVGKTTVGRRLASRLGWTFLDTGVLYRALAWLALERGIPVDDDSALSELAASLSVRVSRPSVADGREADVLLLGVDVTWQIRAPAVDRVVSVVAGLPGVRAALVDPQRQAASLEGAVVVGRDIGTVIFPDAALKVYLEASIEERARRRAAELASRGGAVDIQEVLAELRQRDALDSGRPTAPLAVATDAVLVPTDARSVDEVVDGLLALWWERSPGPVE